MNHETLWVCIAGGMILGLAMAGPSRAQQTKPAAREAQPSNTKTMKESFDTLEVAVFETDKESQFPAEYLAPLQKEIVKELVDAKAFANVVMAGQGSPTANPRTLRLTGLITNYTAGSRAKRYLSSGTGGAAEIDSSIAFVSAADGRTLMSQNLRALLTGGVVGGKSEDALKDYARQIVNKVKLMQNLRVPLAGSASDTVTATTDPTAISSAPVTARVPVTDKDWAGSQKKLNELAATGYRLTGLTITGMHTADAALVRTDATAAQFQYSLQHTTISTNLQKDMNKLAAEGFRASPNTLIIMGSNPVVIMEKATPAFKEHYQYIVKESMKVSSGQKDTENAQNQGFTLVGECDRPASHILLFEKVTPGS